MPNKASKKNRSAARYMWKEKHRKQYTFTKTKFAVGFCTSVFFSVFMGSYFDQFGRVALRQMWEAFKVASLGSGSVQTAVMVPAPSGSASAALQNIQNGQKAPLASKVTANEEEKTTVLFRKKAASIPDVSSTKPSAPTTLDKHYFRDEL